MFNNFNRKKIRKTEIDSNTENSNEENKYIYPRYRGKNKSNILTIFKIFLFISILILIYIGKGYYDFKHNILNIKEQVISINKGESINDLSIKLNLNRNYLKIYLKKNNPNFKLIVGKFKIDKNADINKIIKDLQTPLIENEINITLLEGWNIYDIDNYLTNKKLIEKNDYINYVTNIEKINKLTKFFSFIKGLNTLEGYLYPDTYTVLSNNFKINNLVIKQLDNFENKVYKKIFIDTDNKKINDTIKLASIVEKEEKNIAEKSTVAGILKKRLQNGWMIGADITVCYPHKLTANECKMVITKYINEKSDYNTRTMTGLPKTPIGNPSYETINATLNSKKTSHWFYLHDTKTGKIYYADTNEGHTINKNRYLR